LENFRRRLTSLLKRKTSLLKETEKLQRVCRARRVCDNSITRSGALIVALATVLGVSLILCDLIQLPAAFRIILPTLTMVAAGYAGAKLFRPSDATLSSHIATRTHELWSLLELQPQYEAEVAKAKRISDRILLEYESVQGQFNSRINRLRTTQWEVLQGVPFEQFLESIFADWGYSVETTKVSGDQGVDLIIAKNGVRTAVQAKGYPNSTVGNSAVQEADTGRRFYRCNRSAVITNSTFTSHARRLAQGVGCTLIDHDMIPSLIEGKIPL
jgi:HJR/Mrr/RecB family endonuclease